MSKRKNKQKEQEELQAQKQTRALLIVICAAVLIPLLLWSAWGLQNRLQKAQSARHEMELTAPPETTTAVTSTTTTPEPTTTAAETEPATEPDLRESLARLEELSDEYIAVYRQYRDNPDDRKLMNKDIDLLIQVYELHDRLKEWDQTAMTPDERDEYQETMTRVEQKLFDAFRNH